MSSVNSQSSAVIQLQANRDRVRRLQKIIKTNMAVLGDNLQLGGILLDLFSKDIIDMDKKKELRHLTDSKPKYANEVFLEDLYDNIDEKKFLNFVKILLVKVKEIPRHEMLAKVLLEESHLTMEDLEEQPQSPIPMPTSLCPARESERQSSVSERSDYRHEPDDDIQESDVVDPEDVASDIHVDNREDDTVVVSDAFDFATHLNDVSDAYPDSTSDTGDSGDSSSDSADETTLQASRKPLLAPKTISSRVHTESESSDDCYTRKSHKRPTVMKKMHQSTTGLDSIKVDPRPLKSTALRLLCPECYYAQLVNPRRVGTCKTANHRKILQVQTASEGFISVRAKLKFNRIELCHHWSSCAYQGSCRYAHSAVELSYWKGLIEPHYELCMDCTSRELTDGTHCMHNLLKIVVYVDVVNRKFVEIRFPRNWRGMMDKRYVFWHTYFNCSYVPNRSQCHFPHDKVEEVLWNAWKDKYSRAMEQHTPGHFFRQLCEVEANVTFELFQRRYHFTRHELVEDLTLLKETLTRETYRNKMATLIRCEEKCHEKNLARFDGKFRLRFFNGNGLHQKHHDWYACLVMGQVLADMLRQAATHVDIITEPDTEKHYKAQLLMPQKFLKRTREAVLVIGFDNGSNEGYSDPSTLKQVLAHWHEITITAHFVLKYSYFNNLRNAIGFLQDPIVDKLVLNANYVRSTSLGCTKSLPVSQITEFPQQFDLDQMYQVPALKKLLSCQPNLPFIITGPFGTGKTRVLAASAYCLLRSDKNSRILIAAHHRRTADEYTAKYFTEAILKDKLSGIFAVRLVSGKPSYGAPKHITKNQRLMQSGEIQKYRLVITTFITSLHMRNPGQFTHIFIDEGAQAREPECVAAFRYASPTTKIVIAGDHLQVGPKTSVLGKEARNNGLVVSLLERLHFLYNEKGLAKACKDHLSVLLTNYRCHSAILPLPSALFYHSTIKANAPDRPHPDWKFPLQFVCTSVEECPKCKHATGSELEACAMAEIKAVKRMIQCCINSWPVDEWGEKDLSSICVMTPTRLAERMWKREVYGSELSNVTYTVAYDIQGLEYRAVIVCTSEPVNDDFKPYDPVKSPCDPRVFNTIITRSQSLVIAVGNPFRLMEIERKMPEGDKQCWLSYLQRCWESNTIVLSDELNTTRHEHNSISGLSRLQDCLLSKAIKQLEVNSTCEGLRLQSKSKCISTIEKQYLKSYCSFSSAPLDDRFCGWKYGQNLKSTGPIKCFSHVHNENILRCKLKDISPEFCIAHPVESPEPTVSLQRPENRRCAFNGAIVDVGINKDGRGTVLSVIQQEDIKPVWCIIDPKNPEILVPIDNKTVPIFHLKDAFGETLDASECQYSVSCFDKGSILDTPRITRSIPLDVAENLIFLVQPLFWYVKDQFPCGAPLGVLPKGTSPHLGRSIIEQCHGKEAEKVHTTLKLKDRASSTPNEEYLEAKAIAVLHPDGASSIAFSVEPSKFESDFIVKIHIVNVADSLTLPLDDEDKTGKFESLSTKSSFTLDSTAIQKLSFTRKRCQEVITAEFLVTGVDRTRCRSRNVADQPKMNVRLTGFECSVIAYRFLLHLSDIQDIIQSLDHLPPHNVRELGLFDQIAILRITAKHLYPLRTGSRRDPNYFEPKSVQYPEAYLVVNEFLLHVNHSATLTLRGRFPELVTIGEAVPRHQPSKSVSSLSLGNEETVKELSICAPFSSVADIFTQEGLLAALRGNIWKRNVHITDIFRAQHSSSKQPKAAKRMFEMALSAQQSSIYVPAHIQNLKDGAFNCQFMLPNYSSTLSLTLTLPVSEVFQVKLVSASSKCLSSLFDLAKLNGSLQEYSSCVYVAESGSGKHTSLCRIALNQTEADISHLSQNIAFAAVQVPIQSVGHQSARLWLGCDQSSYVLSVQPQCVELAPNVRVCIQHISNPLNSFTKYLTSWLPRLAFSSKSQYTELWMDAIVGASAALAAHNNSSSLVYKDVILKFSHFIIPPECVMQEMYKPDGIITTQMTEQSIFRNSDLFTITKGDLVCARYEVELSKEHVKSNTEDGSNNNVLQSSVARTVIHMIVKSVDAIKRLGFVQVVFEVAGQQPYVSPLMKKILEKGHFPCELQVITMHPNLRKPYHLLCKENTIFSTDHSKLAWDIALGGPICSRDYRQEFQWDKDGGSFNDLRRNNLYLDGLVKELSQECKQVMEMALSASLQIIQTPPGTHPENLAVILTYALALRNKVLFAEKSEKQKCVLLCVPNDAIASGIANVLHGLLKGSDSCATQVLRISRRREERQYYHAIYYEDDVIFRGDIRIPEPSEKDTRYALHHLIRTKSSFARKLKTLENSINKSCNDSKILAQRDRHLYFNYLKEAEKEICEKNSFDIVICTASEASNERISRYFEPVQVVVYNASMITEPETFSAIHQALHVVLIGDHHQHHPLLSSGVLESAQNGMNVSLFERLCKLIERDYPGGVCSCPLFVCLKEQKDMLESIYKLPSELFYHKLFSATKIAPTFVVDLGLQQFWIEDYPVLLCDISCTTAVKKRTVESYDDLVDMAEADMIVQVVRTLRNCLDNERTTIGVLSYTSVQKLIVQKKLADSGELPSGQPLINPVVISTVDECINQDWMHDVIILSTTSSEFGAQKRKSVNSAYTDFNEMWKRQNLGKMLDPRRLCVALTRSHQGMIILGNAPLLKTCDGVWRNLIEWCNNKNLILPSDQFPHSSQLKGAQMEAHILDDTDHSAKWTADQPMEFIPSSGYEGKHLGSTDQGKPSDKKVSTDQGRPSDKKVSPDRGRSTDKGVSMDQGRSTDKRASMDRDRPTDYWGSTSQGMFTDPFEVSDCWGSSDQGRFTDNWGSTDQGRSTGRWGTTDQGWSSGIRGTTDQGRSSGNWGSTDQGRSSDKWGTTDQGRSSGNWGSTDQGRSSDKWGTTDQGRSTDEWGLEDTFASTNRKGSTDKSSPQSQFQSCSPTSPQRRDNSTSLSRPASIDERAPPRNTVSPEWTTVPKRKKPKKKRK